MLTTYPMNDRDYGAEDAELFHCTRTSGVFDGGDFACRITGADNVVTVSPGIAWIRNAKFKGKVAALKGPMELDMGVANATYPRIDAVVVRYEQNVGTSIVAKAGTAANSPVPPEVVQTEAVYELHLYHVRREAGAAAIPVGALTDLRANREYCGLMQDEVTTKEQEITADKLPVVPVSKGGTGATTAAAARTNLGAAPTTHNHAASAINSGTLASDRLPTVPINKGGTGATNGATGLKNLLASGHMVMSSYQIVDSIDAIPASAPDNSVFLIPLEAVS